MDNLLQIIDYDKENRVESGPVQFGDDWPGLFLRGDHSLYFASLLRTVLDNDEIEISPLYKITLIGFVENAGIR